MKRSRITVSGQVQGVGFRPFVYREATALGLSGYVDNRPEGVKIEVQGKADTISEFICRIRYSAPPLARITDLHEESIPVLPHDPAFRILASSSKGESAVLVSPDVATCDDCLRELFDPADRRYLYPFINCTNCGPRFTLTKSVPYDRATTSMACFPLCQDCASEYANPADRRFHAQPDACPECGPLLWLTAAGEDTRPPASCRHEYISSIRKAARALLDGYILAIKGLGGFHLVCNARSIQAITKLRQRKNRPHKSLAVMVADTAAVQAVATPTAEELQLLTSKERPIVLIRPLPEDHGGLPRILAPDVQTIGLMLPYTPLQHVLLTFIRNAAADRGDFRPPALVMTSGNSKGDPICLGNREALQTLGGIADLFLLHDRDILVRADDSVVRVLSDGPQFIRRARGYVPAPLPLFPDSGGAAVLATGADLKNTLTITRNSDAFVSQYIGDLANPAVSSFAVEAASHLGRLLGIDKQKLQCVVCDMHPDYQSSRFAESVADESGLPLYKLQHHAAHMFSVLAEHGNSAPAMGLILDGTGYGTDHTIWGGELLLSDGSGNWDRLGRLSPFPLPGGEAAIREPWRIACGFLTRLQLPAPDFPDVSPDLYSAVAETVRAGLGIRTSSCGRLFDAASALLGLCSHITYEGQAAIRLEAAQDMDTHVDALQPCVSRNAEGLFELDSTSLIQDLTKGLQANVPIPILARRFHLSLIEGLASLVRLAAPPHIRTIALGGGVLLNKTIAEQLSATLKQYGFTPLRGRALPPGDGAVSYGQAAWIVKRHMLHEAAKQDN